MSDDGRKRPRFEDAATLISEPPVVKPAVPGVQQRQPSRPFGPPPGAPSVDTQETETRVDDGVRNFAKPVVATPGPSPGGDETATRLNMKAVPGPAAARASAIPRYYGQGPPELRGEPVATPIGGGGPGPSGAPELPPAPIAGGGAAYASAPQPARGTSVRPDNVVTSTEVSPFRVMPVEGTNPDGRLVLVHDPDGVQAQQFRLVKFKLKERSDPRAIAVTSARSTEGASTLAANLALALAEGRRTRVALVEANFRSPALAQAFGLNIQSGLTEEIRAHRKDPDAKWTVLELGTGFHLLACGKPADNPAALLNSEEFARLVQELRLYYDFVVIDTPAVLAAADINIVQDLVDGVVIAARAGRSTGPSIRKAISRLAPKNLSGVVLIGT